MPSPSPSPLATPLPWDLVASAYDAEVAPALEAFSRRALELAAPAPGARIVDVACGPGTLAALAARAGHAVDALDFSPRMIERLQARVDGGLGGVAPRVGDGQALPYADATFGAGFSMFGLMFFPDRARGFAELRRVLLPGARAVVSSWLPAADVPALAVVYGALAALAPPPDPPAPPPLVTEDECWAEMSVAFSGVEVHAVRHAQPYASAAELWTSFERTLAPLVLMRERVGPEAWRGLAAALHAALERRIGPGPGELILTAWLTAGVAR